MKRISSNTEFHQNRRGIAILWLILWGSMFLTFFCVVLEVATMWQAHVEVNNTFDSAALAAVKDWGAAGVGSTVVPRNVGIAFAEANPILGVPFTPTSNYVAPSAGNPNGNLSQTGNFVFGSIDSTTDPITFNGNADVSCAAGDVTIRITDNTNGGSADPDTIRLTFNAGTNLAIDRVLFTLPLRTGGPANAQAYFASGVAPPSAPQVSTNPVNYSGLNVTPSNPGPNWNCANPSDVCFNFATPVVSGFRRVQIEFTGVGANQFLSGDFITFGVSTNNLGPAGYTPPPTPNSVGNAWGEFGVLATVTFRNTISNVTSTASAAFVNEDPGNPANNSSVANISGGSGGIPAVIAQGTVPTQGFCSALLGVSLFNVSSKSIAFYNCDTGRVNLVSVDNITFP